MLVENLKFTYLKAIGIVLIVLGHSGGGGILQVFFESWFPIYSFHVPLFVFIAGYFYRETLSATKYVWKRFKRLIIPFYGWHLFYGILLTLLTIVGIVNFGKTITLQNFFVDPWIRWNSGYDFNLASWFLIWLFSIQAIYVIIRKTFKIKNEYLLLIVFLTGGLIGTYMSTLELYSDPLTEQLIKLLFGLPFIQFGYLYRNKLEKYDKPSYKSFIIVFLIQIILIAFFKNEYPFNFVVGGGIFYNVFLPFITSLTGIWFWLQICTILSNKLGNNKITSYLGNHTLDIMIHHMFAFWLLNTLFYAIGAPGFNIPEYRTAIFYEYLINDDSHFLILYALLGLAIPIGISKITSRIKFRLKNWKG